MIRLPESAAMEPGMHVGKEEILIRNPAFQKEYMTVNETLDLISHLSEVLRINEYCQSKTEHKKYL
jgi:hypothetical protein